MGVWRTIDVTQREDAGLGTTLGSATFLCKLCESTDIDKSYQLQAKPGAGLILAWSR